ncbi:hypothetical protein D3C73_673310 [compost metagenome]
MLQQDVLDLGSRHVLTLPAIGVTQAIDELGVAKTDVAQQVAGIEIAVALLEHIVEHDFLGLLRVGVAVQRRLVVDPRQEQPALALGHLAHETRGVAQRRAGVVVVGRQLPGHQGKPHGVVEIEHVGETDVAIAGGVQLADVLDRKARLERFPRAGAQAVADHLRDVVPVVIGARWLVDEVAAQLAHVANRRRAVGTYIAPELAGAELAADGEARCASDGRAPAHAQPGGVIQRQGAIDDVIGAHVQGDQAETRGTAHPAAMLEYASLGQPCRARGIDIETGVVEKNLLAAGGVVIKLVERGRHQVDVAIRRNARLAPGVLVGDKPGACCGNGHPLANRFKRWHQLFTDNDCHGRHQIQAVNQGVTGLRGVEQGTDGTDLGHRQDGHQQFRPVLDEHRHPIAFADALGEQVMSDAIGPLVDLPIAEHHLPLQQGRTIGIAQGGLLERPAQPTRLCRVRDVRRLHALHHPRDGFGDRRQFAEHHAPGDRVARRAAHAGSRSIFLLSGNGD